MDTEDILIWGLVGAVGYWALSQWFRRSRWRLSPWLFGRPRFVPDVSKQLLHGGREHWHDYHSWAARHIGQCLES